QSTNIQPIQLPIPFNQSTPDLIVAEWLERHLGLADCGKYQLLAIFNRFKTSHTNLDSWQLTAMTASQRQKLADQFNQLPADQAAWILFDQLEISWALLEAFRDGDQSPLAKHLSSACPFLHTLASTTSKNPLSTQDYPSCEDGLVGLDWTLFEKAIVRSLGH